MWEGKKKWEDLQSKEVLLPAFLLQWCRYKGEGQHGTGVRTRGRGNVALEQEGGATYASGFPSIGKEKLG